LTGKKVVEKEGLPKTNVSDDECVSRKRAEDSGDMFEVRKKR
jgi:hypothetical protein